MDDQRCLACDGAGPVVPGDRALLDRIEDGRAPTVMAARTLFDIGGGCG